MKCAKTEKQIEETYENMKSYLNREDCCEDLHEMCRNCEKFCGIEQHDYEECREFNCFRNWLAMTYLNWYNSY